MSKVQWTLLDTETSLSNSGVEQFDTEVDAVFWLDGHHCDYIRAGTFGLQVSHGKGCRMGPMNTHRFSFTAVTLDGKDVMDLFKVPEDAIC